MTSVEPVIINVRFDALFDIIYSRGKEICTVQAICKANIFKYLYGVCVFFYLDCGLIFAPCDDCTLLVHHVWNILGGGTKNT